MLTSAQRIEISGKMIGIPDQNKSIDQSIAFTAESVVKAYDLDQGNKSFFDEQNVLVNAYQTENGLFDGTGRTSTTEQDLIDSANMIPGNYYFPNVTTGFPPSIGGVWVKMPPFLLGYGVGKTFLEAYIPITNEIDLTTSINTLITTIEAFTAIQRSTGQSCAIEPMPPDIIAPLPALQTAATDIVNYVNSLVTVLGSMQSSIFLADTDPTRAAANATAYANITTFLVAINTWLSFPNFDPNTGTTTCTAFNAYDPMLLLATKFRADVLNPFKTAIATRLSFRTTRLAQVQGYLGTVTQNVSTGEVTSTTGFYGTRALFISQRLNRLAGSLQDYLGLTRGQETNQEFKNANNLAKTTYEAVMVASKMIAPGNGTTKISVDVPDFATGQTAYVCSNSQPEIELVIRGVSGGQVEVSKPIPPTYRGADGARLYRVK